MNREHVSSKKSRGTLFMQVKHDLLMGIVYSWKKYVVVLFIFIFLCAMFQKGVIIHREHMGMEGTPNFSDYVIDLYKGMDIFEKVDNGDRFQISGGWMIINIFLTYIIGYYPLKDLKDYGSQILIRSKKRWQWWLSKCIWVIASVLIYYAIGYIVISIFSLFDGGISLTPTYDINMSISKVNTLDFTAGKIIVVTMILPIVMSIALSLIQMTISMVTTPILSNVVLIAIIVASAYYCHPLLLGNYLMILRNDAIVLGQGVNTMVGLGLGGVVSILAIIIGNLRFKKMDILDDK